MWHLELIEWIIEICVAEKTGAMKKLRGEERQEQKRKIEREVRIRVIRVEQILLEMGWSRDSVATVIGIGRSTLSTWEKKWRDDDMAAKPIGRPAERVDEDTRRQVRDLIDRVGPMTGVGMLMEKFPHVARNELTHILSEYRLEFVSKNSVLVQMLKWPVPGRVWAVDFAHPPAPVDGIYPYILAVRDLGSGAFLLWLPVPEETGWQVRQALESLFILYGPPLVLKSDNGMQFKISQIESFLCAKGVIHLWSPKYYPQYNGSIESGIGTLKVHSHHEAARNARPGQWTCDDCEGAHQLANEIARPRGSRGPSARHLWDKRTSISYEERYLFNLRVDIEMGEHFREKKKEKGDEITNDDVAEAVREAVTAALVAYGYLLIRRRRISPPYKCRIWSKIS